MTILNESKRKLDELKLICGVFYLTSAMYAMMGVNEMHNIVAADHLMRNEHRSVHKEYLSTKANLERMISWGELARYSNLAEKVETSKQLLSKQLLLEKRLAMIESSPRYKEECQTHTISSRYGGFAFSFSLASFLVAIGFSLVYYDSKRYHKANK
ncbi:MAG: hypothetical protein AABX47_02745 [Nanoarchaeota archaeon]